MNWWLLENHSLRRFFCPYFGLNSFEYFCLTFTENGFNFVIQKFAKIWKVLFSNTQNIRFWAQGFSKTNLCEVSYAQILISKILRLCLAFSGNGLNFVTQKLAKNGKRLFQNGHNICFLAQRCSKTISKEGSYGQILIKIDFKSLPQFLRKWFHFRHSKTCKKLKNALLKRSHSVLSSRLLQNHFLRRFLWPNFKLDRFESFVSVFLKMVSNSSLKNLQKNEKCSFKMLIAFVFELKVAPKPFSEKVPTPKFWFK